MRYPHKLIALPVVLAALLIGVAPAAADAKPKQHKRAKAHVSLHLSGHTVLSGNGVAVRGKVRPSGRHRVKVVFRGHEGGVRRLRTRANGTFSLRWKPASTGAYSVRAHGIHNRRVKASASKRRHLTSYRHAGASYFGPGLYGNGVACGGTLSPGTLGVAHKTLPCGTKVRLRYRGRTITVPVIDRGPYIAGREYDLTEATRDRLRFPGVATLLASR